MEQNEKITAAPQGEAVQLDAAYVIAKIEQIMADSVYVKQSLDVLASGHLNDPGTTAMGISNMIEARERTNQEMISLLKHILNKL